MSEAISYEEVSSIFSLNRIWAGENEFRWYRWCWDTLGKNGLTRFSSGYEKAIIYVRAYTLCYIYAELCDYLADESFNYEVEPDEEFLPVSWLGYILAKTNDQYSGDFDLYGMESIEMLSLCVDTQRMAVSKTIMKRENDYDALIIFIHATFDVPISTDWNEFYERLDTKEERSLDWLYSGAYRMGLHEC